jgi:hypothetical protein
VVSFLYGIGALLLLNLAALAQTVQTNPRVIPALRFDVSPQLRNIKPVVVPKVPAEAEPARRIPRPQPVPGTIDAARQRSYAPRRLMPATMANFAGVGNGFSGPGGTFTITSAPPDTNLAVGPNHVVQIVNTDFAVFNKTGTALLGPVAINTVWSGFGGGCEINNDGDPVVQYDKMADRWIISQFSVGTTPFLECVAVSTSPDPGGTYARYAFNYGNTDFPDYPKLGVWPDAYYITYNIFTSDGFAGARICALDRGKMVAGQLATQQCFDTGNNYGGVLPADLDGNQQPPAGSPNYLLALGVSNNDLAFWKFHVDWTTPGNSTLTGPASLTVAAYNPACNGGTCIPQSGTAQRLDSLADRLMYRLAYRNFGDHEALVVNHSVAAGGGTGVRWYEVRSPGSTPAVFQQGTYAPDSNFRWMGSIAMDQQGNMGLGFSLSGSSLNPAIHYSGRLVGDAAGQMAEGEGIILDGAGSQTGSFGLTRWGDYSAMRIDPSDDCTFWYTTEYIPSDGEFNWATQIASFKFPSCGVTFSANPPIISKSFGAASIVLNSVTSLSFTIHNPNAGASLSGIVFNDPLPSGLLVATPNGLTGSCGGGTITANAGSTSVSLSGATLAASASCTFSVNVQGVQIGTKDNFTTAVTSIEGGPGNGGSATLIVNQATTTTAVISSSNPAVFGQSVTFTASVSSDAGTPTGTVTFLDGASSIGTGTLNGAGVATFTTSTLAIASHAITASYAGDTNFAGSTGSLTNPQVVNKADTLTTVTSSANPSVFGQLVSFTTTVSAMAPGVGTPTGTVTFFDGGISMGGGFLDGSGVITFETSLLAVGSHTITASYGGDGNFNGGTGPVTSNPQVVNKADTTTGVTSSQSLSAVGQSVTFTAGVGAAAPGAGTLTGTVTFFDGATSIGTGTLSGALTTLTTSALTAGTHNITAQYGGDSSFNSSISPVLTQVVGGTDVDVILIHSPDPAAIGGRLSFLAIVSNNGPTATNVAFEQTFTGARALVSATVTQGVGTCSVTTSVSCTLPLGVGQLSEVTIVVTPLLGRNVVGTAKVTPDVPDPITNNNTATSTARIRFKPQRF